ncbi:MAG: hypothetical protein Q8R79_03535 [Legionellaceae bacterium]|nr:hypothetical protein [Legionellaceae bacterium]
MPKLSDETVLTVTSRYWTSPGLQSISQYSVGLAYPAVPVIHPYNFSQDVQNRTGALMRNQDECTSDGYRVEHYLSMQALNKKVYEDENDSMCTPTVKPHYALQPKNGPGFVYNNPVALSLYHGSVEIYTGHQSVQVHDGRVSPPGTEIQKLALLLKEYYEKKPAEDLFLTSYVVSEKDKKILVTHHCLVTEEHRDSLEVSLYGCFACNVMKSPTMHDLSMCPKSILESAGYIHVRDADKELHELYYFDSKKTPPESKLVKLDLSNEQLREYNMEYPEGPLDQKMLATIKGITGHEHIPQVVTIKTLQENGILRDAIHDFNEDYHGLSSDLSKSRLSTSSETSTTENSSATATDFPADQTSSGAVTLIDPLPLTEERLTIEGETTSIAKQASVLESSFEEQPATVTKQPDPEITSSLVESLSKIDLSVTKTSSSASLDDTTGVPLDVDQIMTNAGASEATEGALTNLYQAMKGENYSEATVLAFKEAFNTNNTKTKIEKTQLITQNKMSLEELNKIWNTPEEKKQLSTIIDTLTSGICTLDQTIHLQTAQTDHLLLSSKSKKDLEISGKLLKFKLAVLKFEQQPKESKPEFMKEVHASFKELCHIVSQRRNRISNTFFKHREFSRPDSAKGLITYLSQPGQENLRTMLGLPKEPEALAQKIENYTRELDDNPPSVSPSL